MKIRSLRWMSRENRVGSYCPLYIYVREGSDSLNWIERLGRSPIMQDVYRSGPFISLNNPLRLLLSGLTLFILRMVGACAGGDLLYLRLFFNAFSVLKT